MKTMHEKMRQIERQLEAMYPFAPYTLQVAHRHMILFDGDGVVVCSYEQGGLGLWFSMFDLFPVKQFTTAEACIKNAKEIAGVNGLEIHHG